MEKQNINKTVTFSFIAFAALIWWVTGVLFETAATAFSSVAQFRATTVGGIEIFQLGVPLFFAALTFILLQFNARRRLFAQDVVIETSKVVWPSGKDVQGSTIVVVIMILISSAVIFGFDWMSNEVIRFVLSL